MKKIISILAITLCFANYSSAQVMDSSVIKKPGHKEETMQGDTTHITKMRSNNKPVKNHKQAADSITNAVKPSDKKANAGKPSSNKPR